MSTKVLICTLNIFCFLGLSMGQSQPGEAGSGSEGDSVLAALAKKEKARREMLPQKGPVITNIELTRIIGPMAGANAKSIISEVGPDDAAAVENAENESQQTSEQDPRELLMEDLRQELRKARQDVETASNSYMVLELRINYLRNRLYQEADPHRQQMLQKEMAQASADISAARDEEAEARARLAMLMTEARRAGMLPGEISSVVGDIPVTRSSGTID